MTKKISISIKNKKGIITHININNINKKFYEYNRKTKIYQKRKEIEIKKIKFVIASKKKDIKLKKISKKRLKIKKEKLIKKKQKEPIPKKIAKKERNCNFDYNMYYTGENHIGYVRESKEVFVFDEDSTDNDIQDCINYFIEFIKEEYIKLPCPQRFMYARIHYVIQQSNMLDDIRESSNTTHITTNLKALFYEINNVIIQLLTLIVSSYRSVNVYKFEYVNYELKSVINHK